MKNFFTALLLSLLTLNAKSQVHIEWQKCLGGTNQEIAQSIKQTSEGGYIVAGSSNSADGQVTGNHGNYDFWVVKLDPLGNIEWQNSYGGTGEDKAFEVQQTLDGGYIVAGHTRSNDGDVTGNSGFMNAWVIKLDVTGSLTWQKCYGGTGSEYALSVSQTFDTGYIIAGRRSSVAGTGNLSCSIGLQDAWIIKTDSVGNIIWQTCAGGTNTDEGRCIIETSDSNFVFAGSGELPGDTGLALIVQLDAIGNITWQNCIGGTVSGGGWEEISSVKQTSDGNYIFTGFTSSNDHDVSGNNGLDDVWIVKMDSLGTILWQQCLGGSGYDRATEIHETADGYVITGHSRSDDGMLTGHYGPLTYSDFWILKTDLVGNLIWQKNLGGSMIDECYSSHLTDDGGFILAGYTNSNNYDVSGFHGASDMWVIKLVEKVCTVTGTVFFDFNANNIKDSVDVAISNLVITESNTGMSALTQPDGNYILAVLDTGNTIITADSISYFNFVPLFYPVYFSSFLESDSLKDFAFQAGSAVNDLCITLNPIGNFRAGMNGTYILNYTNEGTTPLSPDIVFYPDSNIQFVSATPTPNSVTPDSVVWNIASLLPFQSGQIAITVLINTNVQAGTLINSSTLILPVTGDANPVCNLSYWEVIVTASYDPNDIIVDRDTLYDWEVNNPPYLEYLIRFQNVGNDTAFTVKVVNTIEDDLDFTAFDFVAASHPVAINLHNQTRTFEFEFENILLPDSNINEPLSHGFIRYRIKPVNTIIVGDSVINNSRIYFDYNDPVYTNNAVTEVVMTTSLSESFENSLKTYPNPVSNELHIIATGFGNSNPVIELYNVFGKKVYCDHEWDNVGNNSEIIIHTDNLTPGIYLVKLTGP